VNITRLYFRNYKVLKVMKYKIFVYLGLSVYIFIQTSFFPGLFAHPFISMFEPKIDGRITILSPYVLVWYYNIVTYVGLLISVPLFLHAIELTNIRIFTSKATLSRLINFGMTLFKTVFVFICTIKLVRLLKRQDMDFFDLSGDNLAGLIMLLFLITFDFAKKEIRRSKKRVPCNE
jgi:hypothetical protein